MNKERERHKLHRYYTDIYVTYKTLDFPDLLDTDIFIDSKDIPLYLTVIPKSYSNIY